ncbi:MAG: hypothetical protein ACF8XB_16740 [Planctomycetota bacterium JB042]
MKNILLGLGAVVLLGSTGCQQSHKFTSSPEFEEYSREINEWTGSEKTGIWLKDRFLDLADIVQFDLSFGDGWLANVHATKWLQAGGGYLNHGLRWGMLKRAYGAWSDDRVEGGLAAGFNLYWVDIHRVPIWGTSTLFEHEFAYEGPDYLSNHDRHWSDVGGGVHLAWLGANVNASPFEAVDFIVGFFGFPSIYVDPFSPEMDIADDDTRARLREKYNLPHYEYTLEHWGQR